MSAITNLDAETAITVHAADAAAKLREQEAEIARLRALQPIELVRADADRYRITLTANGHFWAAMLPAGAERDFIAAGVPVREGSR